MLILGTAKTETILDTLPESFLLIDDGPVIDAYDPPDMLAVTEFDVARHSFNPLAGMDYLKARQFLEILGSVFPQGENTLTRKGSDFVLLNSLLDNAALSRPKKLDEMGLSLVGRKEDLVDAYQKLKTIMLSPVLKSVLCKSVNFRVKGRHTDKGVVLARLDRATLGDFDCFLLGNLLISAYKGHVIIPDFGFYSCPFHVSLMRQGRLTAGLHFLDEVPPKIRQNLLLNGPRIANGCSFDDAEELARWDCRHVKHTNGYDAFIERCMR